MRIAAVLYDRCQPRKCGKECFRFCPRVRAGDDIFEFNKKDQPIIDEDLCVGCGICVHKCPFDAIKIIGLPEELDDDLVHQFGPNGFRLFRLPYPQAGRVLGLLGSNGIVKTTVLSTISGASHSVSRYRGAWPAAISRLLRSRSGTSNVSASRSTSSGLGVAFPVST